MPTSSASQFRERVEIWRNTSTGNDPDPSDFTKDDGPLIAAEIVDVKGGESVRGRTIEASVQALVTIRYCRVAATLRAKDKLICRSEPYQDVTFHIIAISVKRVQGRPWLLEIDCTKDG